MATDRRSLEPIVVDGGFPDRDDRRAQCRWLTIIDVSAGRGAWTAGGGCNIKDVEAYLRGN